MGCFIIAEAGVNHNGDLMLAKELVHAAKEAGADAVKFQTFRAENLVTHVAPKAEYQKKYTGNGSQYDMLKSIELSIEAHHILSELASSLQIEFMSTGFDEQSVDFLIALGVKRLKVPSGEMTNYPLLQHIARTGLPLIVSTGMSYLLEVQAAVNAILPFYADVNAREKITLLHCTSNYPAALNEVNLLAMQTLARQFDLPVGYSDHTSGILVSALAVALGACVIEKHFTTDNNLPGPDHMASLMPDNFSKMVQQIRDSETCLGNGLKEPSPEELPMRELVRRSITLKNALPKGAYLKEDDLILLRPGTGIKPADLNNVIGKQLRVDLNGGSTLLWEHLQ